MAFDVKPGKPRDHLREVMKIFYDGGGRVIDTSMLYGMAEVNIGDYATVPGITRQLFIADKIWVTGIWRHFQNLTKWQRCPPIPAKHLTA